MSLSPEQRSEATRLQRRGLTLREIARAIGASYEDVSLWLYGGVADWTPPSDGQETAPPSEGHEGQDTQERMPESDGRSSAPVEPRALASGQPLRGPRGSVSPLQRSSGAGAQLPDSLQAEPESSHPAGAPSNPWDAERERLAAEHPAAQRFFLKSPDGQFLHESTRVLTRMPRFYWRGTAEQLRALREKEPSWPTLFPVPCV